MLGLRRSLAFDVTALALAVGVAVFGGYLLLTRMWQKAWMERQIEQSVTLAAETLTSALRYGMLRNCRDEIYRTIDRVVSDTDIERVELAPHPAASGDGKVTDRASCRACHSTGSDGAERSVSGLESVRAGNELHVFTAVPAERSCIDGGCHGGYRAGGVLGVIEVVMPLDRIERPMRLLNRRSLVAGAGILSGGAVLLYFLLMLRVRKPMSQLMKGIERVASGDLERPVPESWQDEFGMLARAFNEMRERLASMQRGLIRTERLVSMGKLAAGVAHEINNPLTGILAHAEDLLEEAPEGSEQRKALDVIVRETLRCRKIVKGLLDFARQEQPLLEKVRLEDVVGQVVETLGRRKDFRKVEMDVRLPADLPELTADPVQLQQVLMNLLLNAAEAMEHEGKIEIGAAPTGERVDLWVRDSGPGIPPDVLPRIFEPFYSTKQGSHGLGLAVCHGIVQRHGGKIEVESRPGEGTTFHVLLPVRRGEGTGKNG